MLPKSLISSATDDAGMTRPKVPPGTPLSTAKLCQSAHLIVAADRATTTHSTGLRELQAS